MSCRYVWFWFTYQSLIEDAKLPECHLDMVNSMLDLVLSLQRIAFTLIMSGMSSGEDAEIWLVKGAEAFANMRVEEADQDFQSAVAADPGSAKAHLCLGIIKFLEYQNGTSMQPELPEDYLETLTNWKPGSPPPPPPKIRPVDQATKSAWIAEQNSTNGARAEAHLKLVLELDPHSEPAMEYLAALYFWWLDAATQSPARRDEARRWYADIVETNPHHRFANYILGVIDYEKAHAIIRADTVFSGPLVDENRRRSLRARAGPLLAESARNLLRSLEIEPNDRSATTYLTFIRADQAHIAENDEAAVQRKTEAALLLKRVWEIMEADAKALGHPWPPDDKTTVTFARVPDRVGRGKPSIPSFPPDARLMTVPPAPPPPPPSPG